MSVWVADLQLENETTPVPSTDSYLKIVNDSLLWTDNSHPNAVFDLSHSSVPQAFWDAVSSDGGNIRVYFWDGANENRVAVNVIAFDKGNKKGFVYFDASDSVANTANEWRIYCESGASKEADSATYGAYNVWNSNYRYSSADGGLSDLTSNQVGSTAQGNVVAGNVDSPIGKATDFSGNDGDYISLDINDWTPIVGNGDVLPVTIQAVINFDGVDNGRSHGVFASDDGGSSNPSYGMFIHSGTQGAVFLMQTDADKGNQAATYADNMSEGNWQWLSFSYDTSSMRNVVDDVVIAENTNPSINTEGFARTDDAPEIGRWKTQNNRTFNGRIASIRILDVAVSRENEETWYNNQSDQESFWSVSWVEATEQKSGGSTASLSISTQAGGQKLAEGGSITIVNISGQFAGQKITESGATAVLNIEPFAGGNPIFDLFPPVITGEIAFESSGTVSVESRFGIEIITQNIEADDYEIRYNGNIAVKTNNGVALKYIYDSDFGGGVLGYDQAIDIEIRSKKGTQTGAWSPLYEVYTIPNLPDPMDGSSISTAATPDSVTISYTESLGQNGYYLDVKRVSDDNRVELLQEKGSPPIIIESLSSGVEYYGEISPIAYSAHQPNIRTRNTAEETFFFTTLIIASGGSTAILNISKQSAGQKITEGGSIAILNISKQSVGQKITESGSTAVVNVSAQSVGQKLAEGGSFSALLISTNSSGQKIAESGSFTIISIDAFGGGQGIFSGEGGSIAIVGISATGGGYKVTDGGSISVLNIDTFSGGLKQITNGASSSLQISVSSDGEKIGQGGSSAQLTIEQFTGVLKSVAAGASSQLNILTNSNGQKEASGGSFIALNISASADGKKIGQGGELSDLSINSFGDGTKFAESGQVAVITIEASGRGNPLFKNQGGSTAIVSIGATGGGRKITSGGISTSLEISTTTEVLKLAKGASIALLNITPLSEGRKSGRGGSDSNIQIDVTSNGRKLAYDGSSAGLLIDTFADGKKIGQGGSLAGIQFSASAGGLKIGLGGSTGVIAIAETSDGKKFALGGAQAEILIQAFAGGVIESLANIKKINIILTKSAIMHDYSTQKIKSSFEAFKIKGEFDNGD